jgi:hypothetical protein
MPPTHAELVQGAAVPQFPVMSHVSMPLFEHRTAPGAHTPEQAPFAQAWLEHATALAHWPSDPHVWTPLPEHFVAPGTQTPAQAPLTQANWHAVEAPQAPAAEHVCTPLIAPPSASMAQRVALGAQTPWHPAAPGAVVTHA